jgi:hypothetical protein
LRRVVWQKFTDVSVVLAALMEAASTSETSVNYQTARRNNPEDKHFHFILVYIFRWKQLQEGEGRHTFFPGLVI